MRSMLNKVAASVLLLGFVLPAYAGESAAQSSGTKQTTTKNKTPASTTRTAASSPAGATAEDIRQLRDMLQQQQQQIQQLQQQLDQSNQQARSTEQSARQAQDAAQAATQKAEAAQNAVTNNESAAQVQSDMKDLKTNIGSVAINAQDVDKRVAAAEALAGRFRLSGDVRVRGESFIQTHVGCGAACNDRHRARIRVRLGIDGKLNENFIGGLALATGAVANGAPDFKDPVSTNETLTSYFERKTIGLDRGYITFNPQRAKWISLTGGKWAYSWNRTPMTFDNDLNPDGFNEKLNFDLHGPILKNFNAQAIQLLFNEVSGATDSNAVGASFSGRLQLGRLITLTPTYTLLNWNGADAIAQAASPVTLPNPNTPAVGTPLPNPTTQPVRIINANAFTNASKIVGTGTGQKRAFVSGFESSEFLLDMNVLTPFKRYPVRVFGNYVKNLRARVSGDTAFWAEGSVGQQKQRNDLLVGYSYAEIEQDALISQFNESDMRAATNVLQHRFYLSWLMMPNTTLAFTLWHGHTMDTTLQNAARAPGIPVGGKDPYLNRLQLDIIYKF